MTAPSLAWTGCCALAIHDGVKSIMDIPHGVYERRIGPWRIVLNGANAEAPENGHGFRMPKLPRFGAYIEWNGWPAGIVDPSGGTIVASDCANEDTFIAAVEAELGCKIEDALSPRPSASGG